MKKILLTILILLIPSCTAINKYLESSTISSIEQSHEITTYDPITGNPIRTENTNTTYNTESNTTKIETVVTDNVKENWLQKLWKEVKAKVNYIISILIIGLIVFLFTKFKIWNYIGKFIMYVNDKFK